MELLLKGALLANGMAEKEVRNYGHNMKELVEKACEIMPNADHARLKIVVGHAPKLVERRYQMKDYKRTELGQIMMDAQYAAGEVLRQFIDRDIRVSLIQERTRRGRLFAARQGRVNWGNPPYGYTYVRKTLTTPQHLIINEAEAEVVRLIYRWCVEEQLSCYAIHQRLTAQGIRPRKARHGRWAPSSIGEILRDSLYKGEAYYNRTQPAEICQPYGPRGRKDRVPGNSQGRTQRSPSEWIAVTVPVLMDPETWERAQGQLRQNLERAQRNTTPRRYLLRSLLVCGRCGRRMVGSWSKQGGRYLCAIRYPRYAPGACTGRSLSAATIEQTVWEHVQALLADPEVLRQQYEQGHGDPAVDVRAEHERARLERKLTALEREKTRLVDAYQAEVIELAELAERRQRLTEQGQLLRARVQEIEQQRLDRAAELRLLEGVDAFCASIRDAMVAPSFEVKQKVLQLVMQRIVVEDHRITIEHVVPSGPIRLQPERHTTGNPAGELGQLPLGRLLARTASPGSDKACYVNFTARDVVGLATTAPLSFASALPCCPMYRFPLYSRIISCGRERMGERAEHAEPGRSPQR